MKFPKAIIKKTIDNIDSYFSDHYHNNDKYLTVPTPYFEIYSSSDYYIRNVRLFIKKIAKYYGATIISARIGEPFILKKDDMTLIHLDCIKTSSSELKFYVSFMSACEDDDYNY